MAQQSTCMKKYSVKSGAFRSGTSHFSKWSPIYVTSPSDLSSLFYWYILFHLANKIASQGSIFGWLSISQALTHSDGFNHQKKQFPDLYLQSTLLRFILVVCPPSTWFARLDGSSSLTYFSNLLHSVSWLATCWYSNSNSLYFLNKSLLIQTSGLGPLNTSFQEATTAMIFLCGFSFKKLTASKFYCCHSLKLADLSFKLSSHFTLFTHFLSLLFQWRMWKLLDKTPKFVHLAKKVHCQYIQRPHMYLRVNFTAWNQHVSHYNLFYTLTLMWFP